MAQHLFRLDGKTAFVSGGRGHLGRAMVQALCEAGAHVIVNGRDDAALAAFEAELKQKEFSVSRAAFDIADMNAVRSFFAGQTRLDILVNNAVAMQVKSFASLSAEDFAVTYASSVIAAFESVRAALPALKAGVVAAGEASVINIASMYGAVSPDRRLYQDPAQQSPFHYGPAKAGLVQLTRHLAGELGPENIRVNALVPGRFRPRLRPTSPSGWPRAPCWGGSARPRRSPAPCCSWRRPPQAS
jgi:NAD(P)-dependent dehydrogenase (short-subunit alcohol dehydrogenase family)